MQSWYVDPVRVSPIVMEASTTEDKEYMRSMSKDDIHKVNGTLIQSLYATVIERKNCDFGDIPDSKGDITKCKYYASTVKCLDILSELMVKNNISTNDVDDIKLAIDNVRRYRGTFETAFQLKQEYLILTYNTIVMAIIDATSMIIANYMDYLLGPDQVKYDNTRIHADKGRGNVSLDNLRKFNNEVKVGHFDTVGDFLLQNQKKNFTGTGVVVTGVVVTALVAFIPITRELIYRFYKTRVRMADYMNQQADFLELNELGVKASNKSTQQKKEILKKQGKIILKLRRTADKLTINNEDIDSLAKKQLANDNKQFSLKNIENKMFVNNTNGAGLTIV